MEAAPMESERALLESQGQGHLLAHADTLPPEQAQGFLREAAAQPWAELREVLAEPQTHGLPPLRPPAGLTWKRQLGEGNLRKRLAAAGNELLAAGRVATLLLAGGEGSRLGVSGPKGNVVFGPEDDRTLYRILSERIARQSRKAGRAVPFYVLVSARTEAATRETFDTHAAAWGLEPGQVRFLRQGRLPVLDAEGRALLDAPGQLVMAPDGHGGTHTVLHEQGVLAQLLDDGIDVLTTFQVDNPLGRPLDPVMLGWMLERRAQIVTKVVRKADAQEKVGVLARDLEGRTRIVEYSELPPEGNPDLMLGSIAIHAFGVRWLHDLLTSGYRLPLHRAFKKVPHLGADGARVEPAEPNATKFERFLFDVFPEASRVETFEVQRAEEFAPVKNASGADSLETARALVQAEVLRWHKARGAEVALPVALHPHDLDGAEDYV